jgi:ABC-type branched-subunit amino acid transport system substrate-binding protein/serine/threonine protein kinase
MENTTTSMKCPECQADNSLTSKFCGSCGHSFKGDPTTLLGPNSTTPSTAAAAAVAQQPSDYPPTNGLLPANTILQDRYRITQLLGQGGMGAVYLAQDTRFSSKTCVIKEMLDHFNDPEQRAQATESFHREADMLAQMKHVGIPEVFDRFTESNRHYLVMEYINGTDLEQRLIDNGGPFTEKEVIAWCIQCCDVLSYLHHQKPPIIYRDMKPANVITTNWGKVYLVDFGIARFFNPVSRGTMIGTQGYAPPEQYRGQVEPRSDLYALGATMHYLLTGRDPQNEPPFSFPPVKSLNPDISDEMEMLILKALDPEVENRYASADAMLGQLMAIGGDNTDVIRECPHCGHKSSVTRQFCPNCKQYISKKAHVLNPGSGHLVTDAAGMHQNRPSTPTATLEQGNRSATSTNMAMPTGKTEFQLMSVKPAVLGTAIVAVLAGLGLLAYAKLAPQQGPGISRGDAILTNSYPEKQEGVNAFRAGQYDKAYASFIKASEKHPADPETRIYLENTAAMMSKEPHYTLALAGPFSGKFRAKGEAELQGAAFAQGLFNNKAHQQRLMLLLADDRSDPEGALEVSRRLADETSLVGVVGHLESASTRAALPIYNLAGLPVISPTSTSVELNDTSPTFFRLSSSDGLQGKALAHYVVHSMGANQISVVMPDNNPYIQGLGQNFIKEAQAEDARVNQAIVPANVDWNEVVAGLKKQAPKAVFLAGSHLDALGLAKAMHAGGLAVPLVGGDSLFLAELLEKGGEDVEGLICSTYYHSGLESEKVTHFEETFRGKFGQEPNSRAALTYEALDLFRQAAEVVKPDREQLAHYIKSRGEEGFQGLTGTAKFDKEGNVRRPMYLMKVQNGHFVPLTTVDL